MKAPQIISGFPDEVSDDLDIQINALKDLGWHHIDLRTVNGKNVSRLSDREFDAAYQKLVDNDIAVSCFGSTIANWSRDVRNAYETDVMEMATSLRHMKKAAVQYIRIMSYRIDSPVKLNSDLEASIFRNIKKIVHLAEDNGVICLHENCETWGGQSCHHSLRLLEEVNSPALKLVFDTGNPVSMRYIGNTEPYPFQDSLKFFQQVQEHVAYIHIKDARWDNGTLHYTFPGQGAARIKSILELLHDHGRSVPMAIEPHVAVVFHDPSIKAPFEQRWRNFIDYGNQFVTMAEEAGILFSRKRSS